MVIFPPGLENGSGGCCTQLWLAVGSRELQAPAPEKHHLHSAGKPYQETCTSVPGRYSTVSIFQKRRSLTNPIFLGQSNLQSRLGYGGRMKLSRLQ